MGAGIRARSVEPRLTDMALSFVVFLHLNDGSPLAKCQQAIQAGELGDGCDEKRRIVAVGVFLQIFLRRLTRLGISLI